MAPQHPPDAMPGDEATGGAGRNGPALVRRWRAAARQTHDQADNEDDQEDKEQDLGNTRGRRGHAAESHDSGDQRDHQKNQSPIKHIILHSLALPGTL